jgi:hypothetical protein
MQDFELTSEEAEVLREVLQFRIHELDVEIFHTDIHDYKDVLKHRRAVLQQVLEKLPGVPAAA